MLLLLEKNLVPYILHKLPMICMYHYISRYRSGLASCSTIVPVPIFTHHPHHPPRFRPSRSHCGYIGQTGHSRSRALPSFTILSQFPRFPEVSPFSSLYSLPPHTQSLHTEHFHKVVALKFCYGPFHITTPTYSSYRAAFLC